MACSGFDRCVRRFHRAEHDDVDARGADGEVTDSGILVYRVSDRNVPVSARPGYKDICVARWHPADIADGCVDFRDSVWLGGGDGADRADGGHAEAGEGSGYSACIDRGV